MTKDGTTLELLSGSVDDRFLDTLSRYAALVLEAGLRFNLTGAKSTAEFVPHVLDSLTVVPFIEEPYLDVGSGAGLPGIPAAIVSGATTTLIEATEKKAQFLRETIEALGLQSKVRVVGARAEEAGRDPGLREHFRSGTIRAVASGPAALELAAPFISVGGAIILQRGAAADLEATSRAADLLGCRIESDTAVGGSDRRIVLVRKIAATDDRFPRRVGAAQKHPL